VGIRLLPKGHARIGLANDQLSSCPTTSNCVCSEDASASSYVAPFMFSDTVESAWQRARRAIISSGGSIQQETDKYLWASYTTKWLRFVDDVELRMDADHHVIHVRSASRVGRSDFGVNKARVGMLRSIFGGESPDIL